MVRNEFNKQQLQGTKDPIRRVVLHQVTSVASIKFSAHEQLAVKSTALDSRRKQEQH